MKRTLRTTINRLKNERADAFFTRHANPRKEINAFLPYDPLGRLISRNADTFPYRFSTKYLDVETGLYYYGYRFYSKELMRWLNRDPIEEAGGGNLYAFCGNSVSK